MAQEHRALKTLAASKTRSVPTYALLWTSFRCKLDHDCRFEDGPYFDQKTPSKDQINASLKKSAPKGYYEQTHTSQSRRSKEGIPLFLFFHRLAPISRDDYNQLSRASHPSLFEFRRRCFILIGPASMLNHECNCGAGLAPPTLFDDEDNDIPEFAKDHRDRNIPEKLQPLKIHIRDLTPTGHPGFEKDQQIVIEYGSEYFSNCHCRKCKVGPLSASSGH